MLNEWLIASLTLIGQKLARGMPSQMMDWSFKSLFNRWPSYSPDLTSCGYILWGYVKDKPFPVDIEDIKECITNHFAIFDNVLSTNTNIKSG